MAQRPRALVLGLDGVGFDLVERFVTEGRMPNVAALIARGAAGPLASTIPPTTFPAWSCFLTGAEPSRHGVPDFTIRRGYRVRFVGARDRRVPTWLRHFAAEGLTVGAAWFPATYPPERITGYQIAGWDSPVTDRGDPSFVHPPALHRALAEAFGGDHLAFDAIDEFRDDDAWYRAAAVALPRRIERRAAIAAWLLEHRPVDVAAFYFGEADTVAHHFWAFHDPGSPRRPERVDPIAAGALAEVYTALDRAVGRLVDRAGPAASVIVLSDHGSGGSSDLALHVNRALAAAGLLRFGSGGLPRLAPSTWRGALPALLPRAWRRRLFRAAGGLAPALVESRLRFGGIDWARTVAFSEELAYAPSVWFNQLGREARGALRARDRERAARDVERALAACTAPDGSALVRRVIRREELHRGPLAQRFPDLVLELATPGGYTPVCLPSGARPGPLVERISGAALLGRKGRSLPGCHTPDGVLLAAGPAIAPGSISDARIVDVPPLLAALAGVPPARWFDGRSPAGLPAPAAAAGRGPRETDLVDGDGSTYSRSEERVVAERLRRLGYLED